MSRKARTTTKPLHADGSTRLTAGHSLPSLLGRPWVVPRDEDLDLMAFLTLSFLVVFQLHSGTWTPGILLVEAGIIPPSTKCLRSSTVGQALRLSLEMPCYIVHTGKYKTDRFYLCDPGQTASPGHTSSPPRTSLRPSVSTSTTPRVMSRTHRASTCFAYRYVVFLVR